MSHPVTDPDPDFEQARTLKMEQQLAGPAQKGPAPIESFGLNDRYLVIRQLGEGGMGLVHLCFDQHLQRQVAIKVLTQLGEESLERFAEEAQITGQLEHPNIIPIHEYGVTPDGRPYFVMKRVRGETLDELIPQKTRAELLEILIKICDAVAFAHAKKIVHRDLKPQNVMVGKFGEVVVMDWGIWRSATGPGNPDDAFEPASGVLGVSAGQGRTLAGTILGTPEYMAPEQAAGANDSIDARTDVYSLGAILYEFLCMRAPHRGETVHEIMASSISGKIEPPPSDVPPELSAIAMKALARHRHQRYQSVLDLREDLVRYGSGHSVSARRDSLPERLVKWMKRHPVAVAVALTALLVGGSVWATIGMTQRTGESRQLAKLQRSALAAQAQPKTLAHQLEALSALNRWLEAAPTSSEALARKGEVLVEINRLGIQFQNWEMARHAAREVSRLPGQRERGTRLLARTDAAATRRSRGNLSRLKQIFRQTARGQVGAQQLEAHLFEIVAMRDSQAVPLALKALGNSNPLARRLAARVLGWLRASEALPRLIKQLNDPVLENAVEVALALGRIGDARAERALADEIQRRGGATSLFGRRTKLAFLLLRDNKALDEQIAKHPNDAKLYLERARSALRRKAPVRALADARKARQLAPKLIAAFILEGSALRSLGRPAEAVAVFRTAIEHRRNPTLYFNLGSALADQSKLEQAVEAYDEAIRLNPHTPVFFLNRGHALESLGRLKAAERDLARSLKLDPSQSRAYQLLGRTVFKLGRTAEALRFLRKAHRLHPEEARILAELGNTLRKLGKMDEAVTRLSQGIDREPTLWLLYFYRGKCQLERSQWGKALQDSSRAVELNPRHGPCWLLRARARNRMRLWRGAYADAQRGLERTPKSIDLALQLCRALVGMRRYVEAEQRMRAEFKKTRNRWFLFEIGAMYEASNDLVSADRAYSETIRFAPRFANAYGKRGRIRAMMGRRREALADFDMAIDKLGMEFYTYLANRGTLKLELKRPAAAEQDFRQALLKHRLYGFAYYGLILSLRDQQRLKEAREMLKKLRFVLPRSEFIAKAAKALGA